MKFKPQQPSPRSLSNNLQQPNELLDSQGMRLARQLLARSIVEPSTNLSMLCFGDVEDELTDLCLKGMQELCFKQGGFVYVAQSSLLPGHFKIGFTRNLPAQRVQQLNGPGSLDTLKLVFALPYLDPYLAEQFAHRRFQNYRVKGEFFKIDLDCLQDELTTLYNQFDNLAQKYLSDNWVQYLPPTIQEKAISLSRKVSINTI